MSYLVAIVLSSVITLLGVLVYQNVAGGEKKIEQQLPRLYETDDREFRRSLSALLGPPIVEGNKVDTLINGDEISPPCSRPSAARSSTITFETYIYWSGRWAGNSPMRCRERARSGVAVHVLLDWVGRREDATRSWKGCAGPASRSSSSIRRVVPPGPPEPPDAPEAPGRGWSRRVHRWRGNRRSLAGPRPGS